VIVLGHEVDFLWRSARVVAEVDGYAFHASALSFGADRRRDAELTAAGTAFCASPGGMSPTADCPPLCGWRRRWCASGASAAGAADVNLRG
jgi:hypothetical protein